MNSPARKIDQYVAVVADRSRAVPEFELRRIRADCKKFLETSSPGDARLLYTIMGVCCTRLARNDEALKYYERAHALAPKNSAEALVNLGVGRMNVGDVAGALSVWAEVVDLPEGQTMIAFANLAEALMASGATEDAWVALREAISRADMANSFDTYVLANAAAELGADAEAIEFFARHVAVRKGIAIGDSDAATFLEAVQPTDLMDNVSPRMLEAIARETGALELVALPRVHSAAGARHDVDAARSLFDVTKPARARANDALLRDGK